MYNYELQLNTAFAYCSFLNENVSRNAYTLYIYILIYIYKNLLHLLIFIIDLFVVMIKLYFIIVLHRAKILNDKNILLIKSKFHK